MFSFYQKHVSPLYHTFGHFIFGDSFGCRFTPTCSEYLKLSLQRHGIIQGSLLGIIRFLKCNPFFSGGFDPVPPIRTKPHSIKPGKIN